MTSTSSAILASLMVALSLFARGAHAHSADVIYVKVEWGAAEGEPTERATMTLDTLLLLVPSAAPALRPPTQVGLESERAAIAVGLWSEMVLTAGRQPCERIAEKADLQEGYVEVVATFRCGEGALRQNFKLLSRLPSGYSVILENLRGRPIQQFADADAPTVVIKGTGRDGIGALWGWVRLGILHIFTGLDHLAFLCALLIVGGSWRRVLVMITSFTVAHSITLGATALECIFLDARHQRLAEAAIALSVAYVAVENLLFKEHKYRALVTFGFGLIHGFGFAAVLKEYGLGDSKVAGLLGFNLGVEIGQAWVVMVLYPLIRLLHRRPALRPVGVRAASLAILVAGGYWFVDRII